VYCRIFEDEFMPLYKVASTKEFYNYYEKTVGMKARACLSIQE